GRIDPGVFPNSEVVLVNCALSNTLNAAGWQLNNATSAPNIDWAYSGLTLLGSTTAFNTASWQFAAALSDPSAIANFQVPSFVLGNNWTPSLAPLILVQPAATASVAQGSSVSFAVTAAGAPEPSYQWSLNGHALTDGAQADGSVVSGSATATLTIQNAAADQNGASVTVAVSNAAGAVGSDASALTVIAPLPTFTTQPQSQTAASGGSATFTGAASGADSFQWLFNGAPIAGATSTTLTVGSVSAASAGTYTLVATNGSGHQPSSAAVLNVTAAAGQPTLPVIPNGLFTVTAFGAKGDGATDNTAAIQAAINAAQAAGGGTVEIPAAAGSFLCGPITIGSSVSLQVDTGATLQMLPMSAYPDTNNSPPNFISFSKGSNDQIVGGGTIDGNGLAWWNAFNLNSSLKRPQLVKFNANTNVLVAGVTLANGPTEHLVVDAGNNVTIDGITISAPATSPNTDGIDPAGANFLIENCSIATGDDNIAVKPQNSFCTNFVITGCAFGSGHGLSVGGQTNDGLDGMTVTNCTFNGTSTGLRLKADATQGGPVQNLTYSNITMTNVPSPIVFYSYYNQIGSPGAASGSSQTTPAKVNAFNANPP
ncbi:MAG TPA: glycosyl hydrolase family 28 protein, partial [Polyangia bacterium]|nr:glycosyl hydrolase family 28 protein [Polyangia bacterium]